MPYFFCLCGKKIRNLFGQIKVTGIQESVNLLSSKKQRYLAVVKSKRGCKTCQVHSFSGGFSTETSISATQFLNNLSRRALIRFYGIFTQVRAAAIRLLAREPRREQISRVTDEVTDRYFPFGAGLKGLALLEKNNL